ncbi:MAG: hypothetical protein EZS28_020158 [Streblomastix strix]|uniref:Uncharacterized protein n=1 Tax=Streblomastix strix TaxID=222440 RepID=A0A5J4VP50_9EUKA|nr:MAG: hypothetical protein EZS28_020158 [Streblomastix strix]
MRIDFENMTVECYICKQRLIFSQMLKHLIIHPGQKDYFNWTLDILEAIQLQQIDHKEITLKCSLCDIQVEVKEVEAHIKDKHQDNELHDYQEMMAYHEKVEDMQGQITYKYKEMKAPILFQLQQIDELIKLQNEKSYRVADQSNNKKLDDANKKQEQDSKERKIDNSDNSKQEEISLNQHLDKFDRQEKQELENMIIECPTCKKKQLFTQLSTHLKDHQECYN